MNSPLTRPTAKLAWLLFLAACARYHERMLPPAGSTAPQQPGTPGIQASVAKVDITPPPGVGLAGYGPEGKEARGYRYRLYARVLVLQDQRGERIAFVVADLPHISLLLHRLIGSKLDRLGADRLLLAATHTHSGPGNFYEARQYNRNSSSVPGYDSAGVAFLVDRIAGAIRKAEGSLRAARVAWGTMPVWGHTRNRSYEAYRRNRPRPPAGAFQPPVYLDPEERAIDPTWTLVRVDTAMPGHAGRFIPAGALSIFAIHGTGNPAENNLLDGDIHAPIERALERTMDSLADSLAGNPAVAGPVFSNRSVHVVANGTEGDVSPDWPMNSRCELPRLGPAPRSGGPRSPQRWEWIGPDSSHIWSCLEAARGYVNAAGDALGDSARVLYRRLDGTGTSHLLISRAFQTLHLREDADSLGICPSPAVGTSTAGGAEDGYTRFYRWRFAGIRAAGLEEGGSAARKNPKGCHREKQVGLAFFVGKHDLPEMAQVMVVRLSDSVGRGLLLGAVPAEVTTEAGAQMRRAMAAAAGESWKGHIALIALANGFMQYVTTAPEYSAQHYEGGSTIYGPNSASMFARSLGGLVATLGPVDSTSPESAMDSVPAYPGAARRIFPLNEPPDPDVLSKGRELQTRCSGDTLVASWRDFRPGAFQIADGPLVAVDVGTRRGGDTLWTVAAWDDDRYMEVRALRNAGQRTAIWEMRWAAPRDSLYRVRLLARPGGPTEESGSRRQCGKTRAAS